MSDALKYGAFEPPVDKFSELMKKVNESREMAKIAKSKIEERS